MRTRTLGTMLLVVLGLSGCKERSNAVLILNEQWSVNKAIADCQSRAQEGVPVCTTDPSPEIKQADALFAKAFELEPGCNGLTLLTLNVSDHQRPLNSRRNWWLFLELKPGLGPEERRFTVTGTDDPDARDKLTGQGKMDFIAKSACDFVQGRTGTP